MKNIVHSMLVIYLDKIATLQYSVGMKIAMFTDAYYPRINGVAISVATYSKALVALGHQVCIVCPEYLDEQQHSSFFDENQQEQSICKIIRIASMPLLWSKEDRLARLDKWFYIKKKIKAFAPDIIHINSEWTIGYYGALCARHYRIPFVFTFHTLWEKYFKNYTRLVPKSVTESIGRNSVKFYLKRATQIIVPTKSIEEVVRRYGITKDVYYLPTGVPREALNYDISRNDVVVKRLYQKFPAIKNKKILLFVGRIAMEKNLMFLLDVLKKIDKNDVALLFVGGGPFLEDLQQKAKELGIGDRVFFTGYIEKPDLIYFYKFSNVFVFPSLTDTQGLVTIEAMLSGIPVVAIGAMGTIDVMHGDNGGFMVDNDVEQFTSKVENLLNDTNLYKEKVNEALSWGKKWLAEELVLKLIDYYKKTIAIYNEQNAKK